MNLTPQSETSRLTLRRSAPGARSRSTAADARTLKTVLTSLAPLPPAALFVGLAEDGLPVLLNLDDHAPSPVLVAADAGAGKTRLLQTVARAMEHTQDPTRVNYAVISEHPAEWSAFEHSTHCQAVLPFHHALTTGYLHCAALSASSGSPPPSALVLLIDGLEALFSDGDLRDSAHALLRSPGLQGILPFVTLTASGESMPDAWLDTFRVRLFGYVRDRQAIASILAPADSFPGALQPPCQFAARESGSWLPFWLPELD
jgi:hypothetical protein